MTFNWPFDVNLIASWIYLKYCWLDNQTNNQKVVFSDNKFLFSENVHPNSWTLTFWYQNQQDYLKSAYSKLILYKTKRKKSASWLWTLNHEFFVKFTIMKCCRSGNNTNIVASIHFILCSARNKRKHIFKLAFQLVSIPGSQQIFSWVIMYVYYKCKDKSESEFNIGNISFFHFDLGSIE